MPSTIKPRRTKKNENKNKKEERHQPHPDAQTALLSRLRLPVQKAWLTCLFLVAITLAVYGRSLFNGFINYDDQVYITENTHVRSGLTVDTVRWSFTTSAAGNWHPLTWASHALDVQMFGLVPAGHHLTSIIFHALNSTLLFLLLWQATGSWGRSLSVAALFALHPLNVECVAWAAERKSLLSALFFLLALGAYAWYAKKPSVSRYGALFSIFALGLMAKPMVITLPFVLLLLDYWPLQRIDSWTSPRDPGTLSRWPVLSLLLEKLPLLLLSVASAVITLLAQLRAGSVVPLSLPISLRLENAICSYALYIVKALWPVGLGVFYPETNRTLSQAFLALVLLLVISGVAWQERKKRPYLITGWLWFLGTLVPVIGLVQVGLQGMADRYAYIPLIGIFVMLVWCIADIADSLACSLVVPRAVVTTVWLVLGLITWRQIGFWQSPISLWTHTLQVTQKNFLAEDNFGSALMDAGRNDEAIPHFDNAVRIKPDEPKAHIVLGFLLRERDVRKAIEHDQIALSLTRDPTDLIALYTNLGMSYRDIGNYAAASQSFQQVLQRDPSNAPAMMAMGNMMLLQAADRKARDVNRRPTADGLNQLGGLWEQAGRHDLARQAYQSALALNPKLSSAQNGMRRVSESPR